MWSDEEGEEDEVGAPPLLADMRGNGGGLVPRRCDMDPPDGLPTIGNGNGGASDRTEPERARGLLLPELGLCGSLCRGVVCDALCGVLGRGGFESRCWGTGGSGGEDRCDCSCC